MAFTHTDLKILDPATGLFIDIDFGNVTQGQLLLNILLELRVLTMYMQAMNVGIVADDPMQLRLDAANDPPNLAPFTVKTN